MCQEHRCLNEPKHAQRHTLTNTQLKKEGVYEEEQMKEKEEDEKDEEERGGCVGGRKEGEVEPAIIHQIN